MHIKCWGSRGSIPVSGPDYLKYGGDTTCIEIRTKSGHLIIVDAGTGIRRLGNQLVVDNCTVYHFLFTHSHWDHLIGFPFFKPLYQSESDIQIYRCPFPGKFIEEIVNKMMGPPHFPVRYSDLKAKITYKAACPSEFQIGSVTVIPISLSHPNGGCGYKFIEDGKAFVFLTDNELGYIHYDGLQSSDYAILCENADLLFHDAEYTPEEYEKSIEWGHSTYTDALEMALKAGVKRLGLFHHNHERTDAQEDLIVDHCRRIIEERSARLDCFAVGMDMAFDV
ncbi:MAG: MBL fold metallo-hydrolase [Desulfobacteraceae bacterium]|nr:MBL fold metallo-hydrolase [Desulfobacteraceae bacterium]MBC2758127.1 MBL fold metallo-hydrolase [Desulfobacteraceae bacterium]